MMDTATLNQSYKTTVVISPAVRSGIDALVHQGAVKNQSQFIQLAIEDQLKRLQKEELFRKMKAKLKTIKKVPVGRSTLAVRDELRNEI